VTQIREVLVDYAKFEKLQMVCLGDGQMVEAFGKGNIHLAMVLSSPKRVITMHDTLYVLI